MIHNSSGNWYTRCILTVTDDMWHRLSCLAFPLFRHYHRVCILVLFHIFFSSAGLKFTQAPRKWLALACDGRKYTIKECGFFVKTTWWNVRRHFSGSTRLQWLMHLSCACKSAPYTLRNRRARSVIHFPRVRTIYRSRSLLIGAQRDPKFRYHWEGERLLDTYYRIIMNYIIETIHRDALDEALNIIMHGIICSIHHLLSYTIIINCFSSI